MSGSRAGKTAAAIVAVLLVLHVVPPHQGVEPVVLGALPWDLAYALLWMAAAWATVLWICARVWPDAEPEPGPETTPELMKEGDA